MVFREVPEKSNSYYQRIVVDDLDVSDFIAITLEGKSLLELEFNVNKKVSVYDSELILFFNELYTSLDTFSIILLFDEERIDNKYILTYVKDAINTSQNLCD